MNDYFSFHTATEPTKGGTLRYISKKYSCKSRSDLNGLMYKPYEIESTFVEIINKNKKTKIIGCIYRHPSMGIDEFNNFYLTPLLQKTTKENEDTFLLGDFNIDLLNYNHGKVVNYLDIMMSNLFLPHIILPTRITSRSKTLIDNIFTNTTNINSYISGNITTTISDHLPQFLIIPNNMNNQVPRKHNFFKCDLHNFDKVSFIDEIQNINWTQT